MANVRITCPKQFSAKFRRRNTRVRATEAELAIEQYLAARRPNYAGWLRRALRIFSVVLAIHCLRALVGCSPAGSDPSPLGTSFMPNDSVAWSIFETTQARFARVSGLELTATPGGTPVSVMPRPEGSSTCGETVVTYDAKTKAVFSVDIKVWSPAPHGCYSDIADTLAHEAIHAVRAHYGLDLDPENKFDPEHSAEGVFTLYANDHTFDATSLEKLCEAVDCPVFSPE